MSDLPYTDEDLRVEAARQLKYVLDSIDTDGLLEASTHQLNDGSTWESMEEAEWDAALRSVDSLVDGAADTSEWAISLGADGLEPDGHTIQLGAIHGTDGDPAVRLHFAFHPDMGAADRDQFIVRLTQVISDHL